MKQCLKIKFEPPKKNISELIKKIAKKAAIEGAALQEGDSLVVFACGAKDRIDIFLDILYKDILEDTAAHCETEPFLRDRDFRGIFRIIE